MSEVKTCFKRVDYDLYGPLHYIDIGDSGVPDIQRPFWPTRRFATSSTRCTAAYPSAICS